MPPGHQFHDTGSDCDEISPEISQVVSNCADAELKQIFYYGLGVRVPLVVYYQNIEIWHVWISIGRMLTPSVGLNNLDGPTRREPSLWYLVATGEVGRRRSLLP